MWESRDTFSKMKILPASNASGASSSSSSTSSQVSGLKLGIVRLGRAAGKVRFFSFFISQHKQYSQISFWLFDQLACWPLSILSLSAFICHSAVLLSLSVRSRNSIEKYFFFFATLHLEKMFGDKKKLRLTLRWIANVNLSGQTVYPHVGCILWKRGGGGPPFLYHRWRKDQYIWVPPRTLHQAENLIEKWLWIGYGKSFGWHKIKREPRVCRCSYTQQQEPKQRLSCLRDSFMGDGGTVGTYWRQTQAVGLNDAKFNWES